MEAIDLRRQYEVAATVTIRSGGYFVFCTVTLNYRGLFFVAWPRSQSLKPRPGGRGLGADPFFFDGKFSPHASKQPGEENGVGAMALIPQSYINTATKVQG